MDINQLMSKYILGKADQEEKAALEAWKKESEMNMQILLQAKQVHEAAENLHDYQNVDVNNAWDKVSKRIEEPQSKVFHLKSVFKIAAVFVAIIAASFLFSNMYGTKISDEIVHQVSQVTKINLKDGSVIDLDKNSSLKEQGLRNVMLQGRAYFDISPDKTAPFTVNTFHGSLTVLGTEFNITTNEESSEIYVTEGKVKHHFNNKDYILLKGDMLLIKGEQVILKSNPSAQITSWKSGTLSFSNERLKTVLESIASYYNVFIELPDNIESDFCRINTSYTNESIDQVLKELQILAGLKYEFSGKKVIIKSFKC